MSQIKFYKHDDIPMEMHKVKIVQQLHLLPVDQRLEKIKKATDTLFGTEYDEKKDEIRGDVAESLDELMDELEARQVEGYELATELAHNERNSACNRRGWLFAPVGGESFSELAWCEERRGTRGGAKCGYRGSSITRGGQFAAVS